MKLEEIDNLLGDKAEQGWRKDPENKISVVRTLRARETDGHHNLICQCNGRMFDRKEDLVDLIAAAPTIIKYLVERVRKLEKIKEQAEEIVSWADGNDENRGEIPVDAILVDNLDSAIAAYAKEST